MNPDELALVLQRKLQGIDPKYLIREPNTFYWSELAYCASRLFFNVKFNAVLKPDANMIMGRLFHMVLPILLKDIPDYKGAKFEVRTPYVERRDNRELTIRGRGDVIIEKAGVVEEFKFGTQNISLYNTVSAAYMAQASNYAYLLKKSLGRVIYVHRYKFTVDTLDAKPDKNVFDMFVDKAFMVDKSVHKNEIPSTHSPEWDFECEKCPYTIVCDFFSPESEKEKEQVSQTPTSATNAQENSKPDTEGTQSAEMSKTTGTGTAQPAESGADQHE